MLVVARDEFVCWSYPSKLASNKRAYLPPGTPVPESATQRLHTSASYSRNSWCSVPAGVWHPSLEADEAVIVSDQFDQAIGRSISQRQLCCAFRLADLGSVDIGNADFCALNPESISVHDAGEAITTETFPVCCLRTDDQARSLGDWNDPKYLSAQRTAGYCDRDDDLSHGITELWPKAMVILLQFHGSQFEFDPSEMVFISLFGEAGANAAASCPGTNVAPS